MIAQGKYRARAVAGSEEFSISGSGGEKISLELDIQTDGATQRARTFLAFAGKAEEYSIKRLRALGWRGNDVTNLVGIADNEVEVSVKDEVYNNKPRTVIEIIVPRETKPLDDAAKRAFRTRLLATAEANPARDADGKPVPLEPTIEPANEPYTGGDDDIPF